MLNANVATHRKTKLADENKTENENKSEIMGKLYRWGKIRKEKLKTVMESENSSIVTN